MPLYPSPDAVQTITGSVTLDSNTVVTVLNSGSLTVSFSGSQSVVGSVSTYTQGPQAVSGTVNISNVTLKVWDPGVQAVSGSLSVYTQGAQAISGSVSVTGPVSVYTQGAQLVSGSVSVYTQGALAISGTVTVGNTTLKVWDPGIQSVSGSVSVFTQGPQAVSGSVSVTGPVSVYTQGAQLVSGSVSVLGAVPVYTQGTQGVSGSVSVTGTVAVYTQGPQNISGSVNVGNFPTTQTIAGVVATYTQGTQGVSGSVAVSGPVSVYTQGAQLVSGSVAVYTQGAQAVSGTVTVGNTTLKTWDPGIQSVSGSVSVYTQGAQLVSGTVSINGTTVVAANIPAVSTDPALVVAVSPNNTVDVGGDSYAGFTPDQGSYVAGKTPVGIDVAGNLMIRGPVTTDEGSFRDDFTGAALTTALTGTPSFTNGSVSVTGSGTAFTSQVRAGQYIKKTADAESNYVQVDSVQSDTALTLAAAYPGTTAAAASVVSSWQTVTGTGGSITVGSSLVNIVAGTTIASATSIRSLGDYLPYSIQFFASLTQRIANQTFFVGFMNSVGITPNQQAAVQFSGTNNTQVTFITSFSSAVADTQTTTVTIPAGGTTAQSHQYKIDISTLQATLTIDGVVVATHQQHLPSPYTVLFVAAGVVNGGSAPGSSTTLAIDSIFFQNIDRIQIDHDFLGEPMPVVLPARSQTYSAGSAPFVPAVTPTDIFTITGSATKTIKVTRVAFTMSQTTAAQRDVLLIKRSTANTGGTSTTISGVPHDSGTSAASATVRSYTANPSALGTSVGTVRVRRVFVATTTGNSDEFITEYGVNSLSQPIVLRGTNEVLAVNLNAVTSVGNSAVCNVEWIEE